MPKLPNTKRVHQKQPKKVDPIKALDAIRAEFKAFDQRKQEFVRNKLGQIAELNECVTANEQTWERFIKKRFWEDCVGESPTMKDRSDSLRFVTRFAENAKSRGAAQNASKHAIVIEYLLNQGFEPAGIPAELAKRGHGINATYTKATKEGAGNTPNGNGSAKPAAHKGNARTVVKTQPTDDGWGDDDDNDAQAEEEEEEEQEEVEKADSWGDDDEEEEEEEEQPSSNPQKAKTSGFMSLKLEGKRDVVEKAKKLLKRKGVYLYAEERAGKGFVELLEAITDPPRTASGSERRTKDPRSKATSRRPSHRPPKTRHSA